MPESERSRSTCRNLEQQRRLAGAIELLENRVLLSATPTTTTLAESGATAVVGQSLTFTATVTAKSGKPAGTATFKDGATVLGTAALNSSGKAVFTTKLLPIGTLSLTAVYAGSSTFASSTSSAVKETVSRAATNLVITPAPTSSVVGELVTLKATVTAKTPGSGTVTGTVSFVDGTTALGSATLNSSGAATLATTKLPVGSDKIVATYSTSTDFTTSTSTITEAVSADTTKTSISLSSSSTLLGQGTVITAAVTDVAPGAGTPTGSLVFYDGKTVISTVALDGTGHASLHDLLAFTGTHSITAAFQGSSAAKASTSTAVSWTVKSPSTSTASNGLQTATVVSGSGTGAVSGNYLEVNYIGYLTNGTLFDTSLATGRTTFGFTLGAGQVIAGWDQGLVGIKTGETRVLIIPPALGYGSTAQASIPANSTLIFVVQMVGFGHSQLLLDGGSSLTVPISNGESPATANGTIFSPVKTGQTGAQVLFAISDGGVAELDLTGDPLIQISGADAADFAIAGPENNGSDLLFAITFSPKAKGLRTAKITIPTNDPTYPDFSFTIEGTGT